MCILLVLEPWSLFLIIHLQWNFFLQNVFDNIQWLLINIISWSSLLGTCWKLFRLPDFTYKNIIYKKSCLIRALCVCFIYYIIKESNILEMGAELSNSRIKLQCLRRVLLLHAFIARLFAPCKSAEIKRGEETWRLMQYCLTFTPF